MTYKALIIILARCHEYCRFRAIYPGRGRVSDTHSGNLVQSPRSKTRPGLDPSAKPKKGRPDRDALDYNGINPSCNTH